MQGIYKYENQVNGKVYIGQSFHLENRKREHLYRFDRKSSNNYNCLFYRALRKYGIDSFSYEILLSGDSFSREDLNIAEIYFVNFFGSYPNGYNMNRGGNYTSNSKRFTESEVSLIKEDLKKGNNSLVELSNKYSCSPSLITMINNGAVWGYLGTYCYPIKAKNVNKGELNQNSKISDKEALQLRILFVKKSLIEVYEENQEVLSFSGMKKLLYGVTYKHLPVYKKRDKKWFLGETCIDYPRLEE